MLWVTFGVMFGVMATRPKRNNGGHMGYMGYVNPIFLRGTVILVLQLYRSVARLSCARADDPFDPYADVYWFSVNFDCP